MTAGHRFFSRAAPPADGLPGKPRTSLLRGWLFVVSLLAACGETSAPVEAPEPPRATSAGPRFAGEVFTEIAEASGLDFVHFSGMSGEYYFHEMMGSGCAVFDYDGDGDLDLYLVQGHMLGPGKSEADALFPPRHSLPLMDRLYRNDLEVAADGSRRLRFTDVTEASGLRATGYGMGVATGDFDGDGWTDLLVTQFGPNQLWRNRGDGTFEDVTARAGVGDPRWSVPAVFFDFDRDGWLDLFVGNYVDYSVSTTKRCTTELGAPNYCGPLSFRPETDVLYRNRGDGTFEDVTLRAGLALDPASGAGGALGAIATDVDGDGWPDLYVANDGLPNHLWINQRDGTFRNEALSAGAAVNYQGQPEASMGIDAADFDGDGDEDFFMTHLSQETNTLFLNEGGIFEDATIRLGLGTPSWEPTGFGTAFLDFDNDGRLDLLAVNGAVKVIEEQALAGEPFPLQQTNQLFHNAGDVFEEVTAQAGAAFRLAEVSRGAAFGDVDDDGDVDVVITNNAGPVRLLRNEVGHGGSWVGLRLVTGSPRGRDALGAWVEIRLEGVPERSFWRRVRTAASYASANDPRLLVGLGSVDTGTVSVRVLWPDAAGPAAESWQGIAVGQYTTLRRGSGTRIPPNVPPNVPATGD